MQQEQLSQLWVDAPPKVEQEQSPFMMTLWYSNVCLGKFKLFGCCLSLNLTMECDEERTRIEQETGEYLYPAVNIVRS